MKRIITILIIALIASPVYADLGSVTVKYSGIRWSPPKDKAYGGGLSGDWGYSGQMTWVKQSSPVPQGLGTLLPSNFDAYCIELYQPINVGNVVAYTFKNLAEAPIPNYPGGQPMGETKANYIRELWAEYRDDVVDAKTAQAFQYAIWEIVHEDSSDFWDVTGWNQTAASFMVTNAISGARSLANDWLDVIEPEGGALANLYALTNASKQDILVDFPTIPAPAAVALGLGGVALLNALRRRLA